VNSFSSSDNSFQDNVHCDSSLVYGSAPCCSMTHFHFQQIFNLSTVTVTIYTICEIVSRIMAYSCSPSFTRFEHIHIFHVRLQTFATEQMRTVFFRVITKFAFKCARLHNSNRQKHISIKPTASGKHFSSLLLAV
jgi:hypothetical protein